MLLAAKSLLLGSSNQSAVTEKGCSRVVEVAGDPKYIHLKLPPGPLHRDIVLVASEVPASGSACLYPQGIASPPADSRSEGGENNEVEECQKETGLKITDLLPGSLPPFPNT